MPAKLPFPPSLPPRRVAARPACDAHPVRPAHGILAAVTVALLTLCFVPAQAALIRVTSNDDPEVVDVSRCSRRGTGCSLRDALATADQAPDNDTIVFAVQGEIRLTRPLHAAEPVTIRGDDGPVVRVAQGYSVAVLPDLSGDQLPVAVVQPEYRAARPEPMLVLSGTGSSVTNLTLDGSIEPLPADVGVQYIDYWPLGTTDTGLFTLDADGDGTGDRWPIAGGIAAIFSGAPGQVRIAGNTFRFLGSNGVVAFNSADAVIQGNVVSDGLGFGRPGASADGIALAGCTGALVQANVVTGYRNAITLTDCSASTVADNTMSASRTGLELEHAENGMVNDNVITANLVGVSLLSDTVAGRISSGNTIAGNTIADNAEFGLRMDAAIDNRITTNTFIANGVNATSHAAILVTAGARGNVFAANQVMANGGIGALFLLAFDNSVHKNTFSQNAGTGLAVLDVSAGNEFVGNLVQDNLRFGVFTGINFTMFYPQGNVYRENVITGNALADVVDLDPACNDDWIANTFNSQFAASGACIR